jgi:hypothetical protein
MKDEADYIEDAQDSLRKSNLLQVRSIKYFHSDIENLRENGCIRDKYESILCAFDKWSLDCDYVEYAESLFLGRK